MDINSINSDQEQLLPNITKTNSSSTSTSIGLVSKAAPSVSMSNANGLGRSTEGDNHVVIDNIRNLSVYNSSNSSLARKMSPDVEASGIEEYKSPNGNQILSYRKGKKSTHGRKSSINSILSTEKDKILPQLPTTPIANGNYNEPKETTDSVNQFLLSPNSRIQTEFDKSIYIDEKFLDTQFRYTTSKRDEDFHALFPNVPANDRLLDDFSCALSRELLLQGRIYISEHFFCFNSSLLGWVTSLVISHDDIVKLDRRSTAGLFPNGIIIETKETTHNFASFLNRDQTLNFMETIWSKSVAMSKLNHEESRDVDIIEARMSIANRSTSGLSEQDIFTIDGDSDKSTDGSAAEDENNSDDFSDDSIENDGIYQSGTSILNDSISVNKEKKMAMVMDDKELNFPGPSTHSPTTNPIDYKINNETIVLKESFTIPMGFLYQKFFGDDISLHKKVMTMNDGLNYTDYKGLPSKNVKSTSAGKIDDSLLSEKISRSFDYDKKLNYAIGPSSTRVYSTEYLLNFDLLNYIEVLNITKTPNVPSGGAFDCRTRYLFNWDINGNTELTVSFWVNWTGSSWFKGVIESSCNQGQQKAANDLKEVLSEIELKKSKTTTRKKKKMKKQNELTHPNSNTLPTISMDQSLDKSISSATEIKIKGLKLNLLYLALLILFILQILILFKLWNSEKEMKRTLEYQSVLLEKLISKSSR